MPSFSRTDINKVSTFTLSFFFYIRIINCRIFYNRIWHIEHCTIFIQRSVPKSKCLQGINTTDISLAVQILPWIFESKSNLYLWSIIIIQQYKFTFIKFYHLATNLGFALHNKNTLFYLLDLCKRHNKLIVAVSYRSWNVKTQSPNVVLPNEETIK